MLYAEACISPKPWQGVDPGCRRLAPEANWTGKSFALCADPRSWQLCRPFWMHILLNRGGCSWTYNNQSLHQQLHAFETTSSLTRLSAMHIAQEDGRQRWSASGDSITTLTEYVRGKVSLTLLVQETETIYIANVRMLYEQYINTSIRTAKGNGIKRV